MARPRLQFGSLYTIGPEHSRTWVGRFWVDTKNGRQKRTFRLGYCSELTHAQAKAKLAATIHEKQAGDRVLKFTGASDRPSALPRTARGCYGEYLAAMDLMRNGFEVFKAMNAWASCDLVALRDGNSFRIEVKYMGTQGGAKNDSPLKQCVRQLGRFDVVVVVSSDDSVRYFDHSGAAIENLGTNWSISGQSGDQLVEST